MLDADAIEDEGIDPEADVPPEEEALLGMDPADAALLTEAFGVAARDRGRALVRRLRMATKAMISMSPRSNDAGGTQPAAVQASANRSPKAVAAATARKTIGSRLGSPVPARRP